MIKLQVNGELQTCPAGTSLPNLLTQISLNPLLVAVEYNGEIVDPWGQTRLGYEINGKINRQDFGLKWSAVTEAGGIVVSDEVKLHLNIEMVKQAAS